MTSQTNFNCYNHNDPTYNEQLKRESSTGTASASSCSSIEGEYDAAAAASPTSKNENKQVNNLP